MKFMSKVADTLVDAGHNVTVYSPNIIPHKGPMPTKAHKIDADFGGITLDLAAAQRHVWNSDIASYIELSKVALKPTRALAKALFNSDEFHEWIRQQNFDIVVSEGVGCYDGLLYMLGIKKFVVTVSTNPLEYVVNALGIPNTPSFVPGNIFRALSSVPLTFISSIFFSKQQGFSVPMTYMERALNLLEYVFTATIIKYTLEPEFDGYFDQKFGKNAWSMQKR
ncbi:hypothetical protein COOONC_09222 [Cooperia oncophora]